MSTPKRNSIICNEDSNEYFVNYNEVKVLKNGLNFTSLKVKVFPFFSTSLKVKVLKLLLKYNNALLLLRYCTTLGPVLLYPRIGPLLWWVLHYGMTLLLHFGV